MGLVAARDDDSVDIIAGLLRRVDELERLGASRWGKSLTVDSATSTSDQTGIGASFTDITFASLSWTSVLNRLYEVTLQVKMQQVTSTGSQFIQIQTGTSGAGTNLAELPGGSIGAGSAGPGGLTTYILGTGGTLSVHARAATTAGTLTIQNSVFRGWFVVKDVGVA